MGLFVEIPKLFHYHFNCLAIKRVRRTFPIKTNGFYSAGLLGITFSELTRFRIRFKNFIAAEQTVIKLSISNIHENFPPRNHRCRDHVTKSLSQANFSQYHSFCCCYVDLVTRNFADRSISIRTYEHMCEQLVAASCHQIPTRHPMSICIAAKRLLGPWWAYRIVTVLPCPQCPLELQLPRGTKPGPNS